jgi:hypothetical protein
MHRPLNTNAQVSAPLEHTVHYTNRTVLFAVEGSDCRDRLTDQRVDGLAP